MYRFIPYFFTILSMLCFPIFADLTEDLLKGVLVEGIAVDLREPTYCDGVLTSEKGGVIVGPKGFRIQARKIVYTRKMVEGQPVCNIVAENDLMLEFGRYIFVGQRLEYDFQTGTGVLFWAHTGVAPWYIGGEAIQLCSDGSYIVYNGLLTTSESQESDWNVSADQVKLHQDETLTAKNVTFHLAKLPIFWWPSLNLSLDTIFDNPFEYTIGWGGRQGPRLGLQYEVFSWNRWKTAIRFDYRLKHGFGGGFSSAYHSEDYRENFEMINYAAQDASIFIKHEHFRYRYQGGYNNLLMNDKLSIDLTWDKLSDKDMATDYADQGLELEVDGRTELEVRFQEDERWITNFVSRVRVNSFETVLQQLPTLETTWHPFTLGSTGIVSDNLVKLSYLNFVYAKDLHRVHDYDAARLAFTNKIYRPFDLGPVIATPEIGVDSAYYSDSPSGKEKWAVLGTFGCDFRAPCYKNYVNGKHVITPYVNYKYLTFPNVSPKDHYIFDIDDGLYRLNMVHCGLAQSLYGRDYEGNVKRVLYTDLFTYAFIDTPTLPHVVPRIYWYTVFNTFSTLRHTIDFAWDVEQSAVDHFNFRSEWTVNSNLAISLEYRYRDAFFWRKADRTNFILDSFRTAHELLDSQLSDRRNTALVHFFYRFHPSWAIEYESRHGWHTRDHTVYNEFEVDILATLRSAIQAKVSYQHNEAEDRVAVYFSIGADRPDRARAIDLVPILDF